MRLLGVDPGAVHVGVSEWEDQTCVAAYELTPQTMAVRIHDGFTHDFDVLCAEDYFSQGGFGSAQSGRDTTMLLGYLTWDYVMSTGRHVRLTQRGARSGALKRLQAVGYPFVGAGRGDHARDAEAVVVAAMKWSAKEVSARPGG